MRRLHSNRMDLTEAEYVGAAFIMWRAPLNKIISWQPEELATFQGFWRNELANNISKNIHCNRIWRSIFHGELLNQVNRMTTWYLLVSYTPAGMEYSKAPPRLATCSRQISYKQIQKKLPAFKALCRRNKAEWREERSIETTRCWRHVHSSGFPSVHSYS